MEKTSEDMEKTSEDTDEEFEGWTSWLEYARVVCKPEDPECLKHPCITRTETDMLQYTVDDEIKMMNKQIQKSEGFDIDYSLFRCVFNYHPVYPNGNDIALKPGTDMGLLNRVTQESLKRYNKENNTSFEFLKVEKANFHWCSGFMLLITFQVLDPSDKQPKDFQSRIRYTAHYPTEYVFCRPKPDPNVESDSSSSEEDVKGFDS